MRNRSRTLSATLMAAALLAAGTTVFAGGLTLEERVERLERRGEMPPPAPAPAEPSGLAERIDALEAALKAGPFGLKIGGMVVASYQYNFNDPVSDITSLRGFDRDHNSFVLDLFQLQVSREPGDNGVGFVTKINFGKTAERMASDWDGDGSIGNTSEEDNSVEVQDAFVTYNFPGAPEIGFKAGKFVTLLGAEVIESPLNYNISRSLAFSWAIPFTHTGFLATFAPAPEFSANLGLVNGWDNVVDSNDGKSVLGNMVITPAEQFSLALGGIYGAEQGDRGDSKRGLVDVIATIKPVDTVALVLNYDYGNETDRKDLTLNDNRTVEWQAVSGIFAVDVPDAMAVPIGFAVRGEYFDDSDGSRLGATDPLDLGIHQRAWEVTGTFKVVLAEGFMLRTEYRYDWGKNDLYEQGFRNFVNFQDDQHTVAAEVSYVF